jgi:hypothetical protein
VGRIPKIVALSIGLAAFAILAFFGFAIWVFIPIFPAGILFVVAVYMERTRTGRGKHPVETNAERPQKAA